MIDRLSFQAITGSTGFTVKVTIFFEKLKIFVDFFITIIYLNSVSREKIIKGDWCP